MSKTKKIRAKTGQQPNSDINVTPLVDVVLVLLIIFMVTAPFLQGGFEIDLPKVAARGLDVREGLIVTVRADQKIAVRDPVTAVTSIVNFVPRNALSAVE